MRTSRSLLIALLIALPALGIYGQQTGEVTGTVTDATGAAVAGSTVTATNTVTQQVRTAASNDTGMYTLPYLQAGVYDIRAERRQPCYIWCGHQRGGDAAASVCVEVFV